MKPKEPVNCEEIKNKFFELSRHCWHSAFHAHFYFLSPPGPDRETRFQLRRNLVIHLEKLFNLGEKRKQLLEPGLAPRCSGLAISISHCRLLAGFIFESSSDSSLGLDIEERLRVTHRLVRAVATDGELSQAPCPAFLWSAKESAFKAVNSPERKLVLGQIRIDGWQPFFLSGSKVYTFRFYFGEFQGQGHLFILGGLVFATARMALGGLRS